MKYADNTGSNVQAVSAQTGDTGLMNTAVSSNTGNTLAVHSEQVIPVHEVERDDLTAFFTVGVVINIVMITAYFIWAYKQLGKTGTDETGTRDE